MTREQYKSLQLVQLKELAKSRGLKHISTLKKDELIELLKKGKETKNGANG